MRKLFAVLLLLIIGESAYAEYVTILPVDSHSIASASSGVTTLSELYGKGTTIRYMTNAASTENIALNNTNIYPTDTLTLTEDVLVENKLFGFYIGAARQIEERQTTPEDNYTIEFTFTASEQEYQSLLNKARAEAGSNIAIAKILEEQIIRTSASELLTLNSDSETGDNLLDDGNYIDSFLPGSSQSYDYDLPAYGDNIIISGLGGAILNGGGGAGSGSGGNGGYGFANGGGSTVPEPSTWMLLILGVTGLAVYRKRVVR